MTANLEDVEIGHPFLRDGPTVGYESAENVQFRNFQLRTRLHDVSVVLAALKKETCDHGSLLFGTLDLNGVLMAGHSFGAATTLLAVKTFPSEISMAAAIDAWMLPIPAAVVTQPLDRPVMFINAPLFHWNDAFVDVRYGS